MSGLGGGYGPFNVAGFHGAQGGRHDRLGAQGGGHARLDLAGLKVGYDTGSTSPASAAHGAEGSTGSSSPSPTEP